MHANIDSKPHALVDLGNAPRRGAITSVSRRLLFGLGLALATMTVGDAALTALGADRFHALLRQIDLTREGNVAAWVDASVFIAVAFMCVMIALEERSARRAGLGSRCVWLAIALACAAYGLTTALNIHDLTARRLISDAARARISDHAALASRSFALEGVGMIALAFALGFFALRLRLARRAWWWGVLGIALLASSPVTERFETRLVSNPNNYVFVANDQPYRFTATASDRLWMVGHVKEGSEAAGALALFAALVTYAESLRLSNSTRPAASHRVEDGVTAPGPAPL